MTMDLIRASNRESCLHQDNKIKITCGENVACNHQTETPKSVSLLKWRAATKIAQMIPTNLQLSHSLAEPSFVALFAVLCYLLFVCITARIFSSRTQHIMAWPVLKPGCSAPQWALDWLCATKCNHNMKKSSFVLVFVMLLSTGLKGYVRISVLCL